MVIDPQYRVRGYKTDRGIVWCAQRRVRFLFLSWWWPLTATSHRHAEQAWHDVEYHQLAEPQTQYVKPEPSAQGSKPPPPPKGR